MCIHYFLIKRKKLFGRPNILRYSKLSLGQSGFPIRIIGLKGKDIFLHIVIVWVSGNEKLEKSLKTNTWSI